MVFEKAFPNAKFDNDSFPFGTLQVLDEAKQVRALRVSFVGELGWELHIPKGHEASVYDHMFSSATAAGVDLRDAGMFALLQSLRMEKGFVHNGHDIHPRVTPMECGLAFAVGWKKGDFSGKAVLEERKAAGPRERLV